VADSPVLRSLLDSMQNAVLELRDEADDPSAVVALARQPEALRLVREKEDLGFDVLLDLTAVDRYAEASGEVAVPAEGARSDADAAGDHRGAEPGGAGEGAGRFEVVYQLASSRHGHRLRLRIPVPAEPAELDSATALWPAADWLEREVYDLYGIRFRRHPALRRLLLDEGFAGHPLRKDWAPAASTPGAPGAAESS